MTKYPFEEHAEYLLRPDLKEVVVRQEVLTQLGFLDIEPAIRRLASICETEEQLKAFSKCFFNFMYDLSESANPDQSLLNFERFVQRYSDRQRLFEFLAANPRAVEILVRLFVGSQFLTEILLRNPDYLETLTNHKALADFKNRQEFYLEAWSVCETHDDYQPRIGALRHYQQWELLRIGACDSFGLMDFKSVTLQLSLLADALVQTCLQLAAQKHDVSVDEFIVLGFGKLGGEELNYSSDIDLIFIAQENATKYWAMGQTLIEAISKATSDGFLYRVDMRLRPWGRSGALVSTEASYLDYLKKHGMLWEKQALLKARPIAGNLEAGAELLKKIEPIQFDNEPEEVRQNVVGMKLNIERELRKQGREWGEVKGGVGSIRDVEFLVQYLQMIKACQQPEIRSINTLDGLVRLVELELIRVDEYRRLADGYVFLRTIEHALQLTHYKQIHHIPREERELAYLARKLDFPDPETFVTFFERHSAAIRRIYERYVETPYEEIKIHNQTSLQFFELIAEAQPDYASTFSEEEIQAHIELLEALPKDEFINVQTTRISDQDYRITIVGADVVGQFSVTCGLLFSMGFDILRGHVFTGLFPSMKKKEHRPGLSPNSNAQFVTVIDVRDDSSRNTEETWHQFLQASRKLNRQLHQGKIDNVQGTLARRVGQAYTKQPGDVGPLLPVEITIHNDLDEESTVVDISGDDIPGFLYGLSIGFVMRGIQISRVLIDSTDRRVQDRLYFKDSHGNKVTDESQLQMLRVTILLIRHIAHFLPIAPDPQSALLQFRQMLEELFQQEDWVEKLASLEQPEVLSVLAQVLGVGDFLWEDFLRLQYENLFPVFTDIEKLKTRNNQEELAKQLKEELASCVTRDQKVKRLNAFKDRELVRIDMRHILEYDDTFGEFSLALTNIAEVIVRAGVDLVQSSLIEQWGEPLTKEGKPCRSAVFALGKCGGKELGFASDIELIFVYEDNGETTGKHPVTTAEYFQKLVEDFQKVIMAKRDGIFEIDLRLRPYGNAGNLAVSKEAFDRYFSPEGAAWPYERQALVKMRPIDGDPDFAQEMIALRDELVYTGEPFDVAAMRGMREKQVRQLVRPGTINAKLSPGGLVDCEYLVQGLQITYGKEHLELRTTNTREALRKLESLKLMSHEDRIILRDCYRFLRSLIDSLRIVRGNASDLTIPPLESEEFYYLTRRTHFGEEVASLHDRIEEVMQQVLKFTKLLEPEDNDQGG